MGRSYMLLVALLAGCGAGDQRHLCAASDVAAVALTGAGVALRAAVESEARLRWSRECDDVQPDTARTVCRTEVARQVLERHREAYATLEERAETQRLSASLLERSGVCGGR